MEEGEAPVIGGALERTFDGVAGVEVEGGVSAPAFGILPEGGRVTFGIGRVTAVDQAGGVEGTGVGCVAGRESGTVVVGPEGGAV